jgi:ribose-phosphate pyrophosphokinase
MSKKSYALIGCASALEMSKDIEKLFGEPFLKYEMTKFANTETRTKIGESVRNKDLYVIATSYARNGFSVNDNIMEVYLLAKTARTSGCKSLTLVMLHYGYARQDKKTHPRDSISAQYITQLYEFAGFSRIVAVDLHSAAIQGFFDGPFDNIYGSLVMKPFLDEHLFANYPKSDFVAVSPDAGGYSRTKKYADLFKIQFTDMIKCRDYTKENVVMKSEMHGAVDISGKTAVIFDDMVDTGNTIKLTAINLKKAGASEVVVVVTHSILSNEGFNIIKDTPEITMFICTDSVPQEDRASKCPKMKVVSVAPILKNVIRRLIDDESISELFV